MLLSRSSRTQVAEDDALLVQGALTADEVSEFQSLAEPSVDRYRKELQQGVEGLRDNLSRLDPVMVMAHVGLAYGVVFGDFFEPMTDASEVKVEFVAGLLASVRCAPSLEGGEAIVATYEVLSEVDEIFSVATLLNIAERVASDAPEAEHRYHARARHLAVRGTGYPQHGLELARRIYDPYSTAMKEAIGFDLDTLINLEKAIMDALTDRVGQLRESAIAAAVAEVEDAAESPEESDGLGQDQDHMRAGILNWTVSSGLPAAMSFSAAELAEISNVDQPIVDRVLERLTLPLGENDESYNSPFQTSPLVTRPFVSWNGRYLLPAPGIVGREYVTLIERHLNQPSRNFHKRRAQMIDDYAIELIASRFPGCHSYGHLFYTPPGEGEAETDGLILWDDIAVVVEGKGARLGPSVDRGDVARLRSDIASTIEHAWAQGKRVREQLLSESGAEFHAESGEIIRVEPGEVSSVFVINPTIHLMSDYAPQLSRLQHLGLFADGEYPFSVYVNDLRIIAETLTGPAEFLSYLSWRSKLPLGDLVLVGDEIDLLGTFLLRGQLLRRLEIYPGDLIVINGSTVDFDDFYMADATGNTRARQPKMFSVPPVTRFIERLEQDRPEGWRAAAEVALELSLAELILTKVIIKQMSGITLEDDQFLVVPLSALPVAEGDVPADDDPSLGFIVRGHGVARDEAWERSRAELHGTQRVLFMRMSSRGRPYIDWALDQGFVPPDIDDREDVVAGSG
ncbi:MAG TPA: hypothetical protein VG929_12305 [Actinomycetota bacterium]|nr:hypothetical protein [Actinomycetota bacterium]